MALVRTSVVFVGFVFFFRLLCVGVDCLLVVFYSVCSVCLCVLCVLFLVFVLCVTSVFVFGRCVLFLICSCV